MLKSKSSAFFSLLLVFLSGAMVGVFGERLYNAPPASGRSPEEVRTAIIAEMRKEVKVDDQQVAQLNHIYDETEQQFMQVRKKQNAEGRAIWDSQTAQVRAILRPDQVALFDALHAKHEAERKKRQQEHHKGPPPPDAHK